jgi:hypothetical protein
VRLNGASRGWTDRCQSTSSRTMRAIAAVLMLIVQPHEPAVPLGPMMIK